MKKKYRALLAAFFMILAIGFSMTAQAAYPPMSEANPVMGYGWQMRAYTIYSDPALTQKAETVLYQECMIISISENAAQVAYRDDEQVKKTGWISLKRLIYDPEYPHQVSYANAGLTLYMRPTVKAEYVAVPQYSGGVTVSERGSWVQVIFRSGDKYYIGWIQKHTYQGLVRLSMETTKQPLANGTYTISPRNAPLRALTYKDGRFALEPNRKGQNQKFILRYVSGGNYLITLPGTKQNLSDNGGLTVQEDNNSMWRLTRSGGCFYLQAKNSMRGLSYTSGGASMANFRKLKAQQWKFVKVAPKPQKENSVVFSQYDPKWGGSTYMNGPSRRTISTSGCGVMALTNAVYALNGEFIHPELISKFSVARGHYFYNQGTADTLYKDFAKKYGRKYHFVHSGKTYSLSTVQKYLKKGSTAVALVPGHYIAIVAYRKADNHYLVLDSAVYGKRPTTIYGDWVPASTMRSGTMWCEYFSYFIEKIAKVLAFQGDS